MKNRDVRKILKDTDFIHTSGTAEELISSLPETWKPVLHALSLEDVYLCYLGEDKHD